MTKQELLAKYKEVPVKDIISAIRDEQAKSFEHMKSMVGKLYFLELSKRYKEDPQYKKSSFEDFIGNAFPPMTYNKYYEMRQVYVNFEEEARSLSPEVVARAYRKCGALNMKKALTEMKNREEKTGKQIPLCAKYDIIEKYERPKPEVPANTEPAKPQLYKTIDDLRIRETAQIKLLETKDQQIERLKKTVLELQHENAQLKAELKAYKEMETAIVNVTRKYLPEACAVV